MAARLPGGGQARAHAPDEVVHLAERGIVHHRAGRQTLLAGLVDDGSGEGVEAAGGDATLEILDARLDIGRDQRIEGREADHAAKQLFGFSILYLFLLFVVLLGEHAWQRLVS